MHWWAGFEISSTWSLTRATKKAFVVAALLPPLPACDVLLACAEDRHPIGDYRVGGCASRCSRSHRASHEESISRSCTVPLPGIALRPG